MDVLAVTGICGLTAETEYLHLMLFCSQRQVLCMFSLQWAAACILIRAWQHLFYGLEVKNLKRKCYSHLNFLKILIEARQ